MKNLQNQKIKLKLKGDDKNITNKININSCFGQKKTLIKYY